MAEDHEESWPLFSDHEMAAVPMPKSIRFHPVAGFGLGTDPAGAGQKNGAYERSSAFAWIASRPEVEWRRSKDNPHYLALKPNSTIRENPAAHWGWTKKFTRRYISALVETGLIDERLCRALDGCTVDPMAGRKREPLSSRKRDAVMKKTSGKCAYCGVKLTVEKGHPHSYHADHVFPVTRGGTDDIANLIPSCRECNGRKSAKTALQFMGE